MLRTWRRRCWLAFVLRPFTGSVAHCPWLVYCGPVTFGPPNVLKAAQSACDRPPRCRHPWAVKCCLRFLRLKELMCARFCDTAQAHRAVKRSPFGFDPFLSYQASKRAHPLNGPACPGVAGGRATCAAPPRSASFPPRERVSMRPGCAAGARRCWPWGRRRHGDRGVARR